jgi:hypothetical protein
MKKKFNLQLFADEAATATATGNGEAAQTGNAAAEQEKTTEDKKPETAAQQSKADEKVFTHAEFDRLFNQKYAELEKKKQKELDEAKKLAAMNAEEKANFERDKAIQERDDAIKERDELKKAATLAEITKTARKMLAEDGINVSDELLAMIVNPDAEKTKAAVDGFKSLFSAAVESGVKERLKGETPRIGTGGSVGSVSEIDKRIKKYE